MEGIEGKVVVVTGAARGIGKAIAERFSREKAHVVMADLLPEVKNSFEDVKKIFPGTKGFPIAVDVTQKSDTQRMIKEAVDKLGRIDVLVNNAGINIPANPVATMPEEDFDRALNVNLKGIFLCSQAVSPLMMKQRAGKIINIASYWGKTGHPFFSGYCASKAGVIVLTQSHAEEMGPYNVTVNSICPGNTATTMHTDAIAIEAKKRGITYDEMAKIEYDKVPLRRVGKPEEVAAAVVFLASSDADYITGAAINVNGGVEFH